MEEFWLVILIGDEWRREHFLEEHLDDTLKQAIAKECRRPYSGDVEREMILFGEGSRGMDQPEITNRCGRPGRTSTADSYLKSDNSLVQKRQFSSTNYIQTPILPNCTQNQSSLHDLIFP